MNFTLDRIVREFLVESLGAEQIDNRYARLLQIAINGLRDLKRHYPGETSYAVIDVNDNHTVTLPNGYIEWIKVGVCYNGQILALGQNDNMCPPGTDSCGNIEVDQPVLNPIPFSLVDELPYGGYNNDGYNGDYYNLYGLGGGQNTLGRFKIFRDEGYIALQSLNTNFDQVILEYKADIELIDGQFFVHPYDVESLKAWIWWKYIERNLNYPFNERENARIRYKAEKHRSLVDRSRLSLNEIISAVRSGYKSSPNI